VELAVGRCGPKFGVGIHANLTTASLLAVISAVNRSLSGAESTEQKMALAVLRPSPTAA